MNILLQINNMVYFQYLFNIINTKKLTKNKMKNIPQVQMELVHYKDSIVPAPFSRH